MKYVLFFIVVFIGWGLFGYCMQYIHKNEPSAEIGAYIADNIDAYKANVDSIRKEKATQR